MGYLGMFFLGVVVGAVTLAVSCLAIAKNYKDK